MTIYNEKPWTKEEDDQLNTLYNLDMLNVMEISKMNKRCPFVIFKRLKEKKYIESHEIARGVADHLASFNIATAYSN
jgi:hypothetical protein